MWGQFQATGDLNEALKAKCRYTTRHDADTSSEPGCSHYQKQPGHDDDHSDGARDALRGVRLSLSSDPRSMVALQQSRVTSVWLIPAGDPNRARQITFGAGGYRSRLAWSLDGKIVYDLEVGEAGTISVKEAHEATKPKRPKFLSRLGDLSSLLNDAEYFAAFRVVQAYNLASDDKPRPT